MKDDLISRSASVDALCVACNKEYPEEPCEPSECLMRQALEECPAVDAVPVVHGRWENYVCVACGFDLRWLTDGENDLEQWVWDEGFDYCPNCGAKMDGGKDDGQPH